MIPKMQSYETRSITDSRRSSLSVKSRSSRGPSQVSQFSWNFTRHSYASVPSQVSEPSWNFTRRSFISRKTGDDVFPHAVAAIICDTICRLELITAVINEEINPSWKWLGFYKPPEQRFTEKSECESEKYNDFKKFKKYSCFLLGTLKTFVDELVISGTISSIVKVEKWFCKQDKDEEILRQEHNTNRKRLEEVRNALKNAEHKNKEELNKKADELHNIREAYKEKLAYSLLELKYVNAYEDNRCYLQKFSNDIAEQNLRGGINAYEVQIMNENRIHSEIEEYLESYALYVENETRNWIIKYDADEERFDQELSEAKERNYELELEHSDLQREYRQRSTAIDEWLVKRKQIREEEERLRLRNRAATFIQALWRGEMQRRRFGTLSNKRKARRAQAKGKKNQAKNFKLKK